MERSHCKIPNKRDTRDFLRQQYRIGLVIQRNYKIESIYFDAVWNGDEQTLTQEISRLLRITISYHDYREDFYHAFLAGIFAGAGYSVESNKESWRRSK